MTCLFRCVAPRVQVLFASPWGCHERFPKARFDGAYAHQRQMVVDCYCENIFVRRIGTTTLIKDEIVHMDVAQTI